MKRVLQGIATTAGGLAGVLGISMSPTAVVPLVSGLILKQVFKGKNDPPNWAIPTLNIAVAAATHAAVAVVTHNPVNVEGIMQAAGFDSVVATGAYSAVKNPLNAARKR